MDARALEQLRALRAAVSSATTENEALRDEMLVEARGLLLDLERPDNAIERVCFQTVETVIITVATRMGILKALNSGIHRADQIAEACKADPVLVGRVLRGLAAFGAVAVESGGFFRPSTAAKTFGQRKGVYALEACEFMRPGWLAIPAYLEDKGWRNPTSSTDTPLAKGYNRVGGATAFEIATTSPLLDGLMSYMATHNEHHREWYDFYPVMERLAEGAEQAPDSVMMVDVGGGRGQQAINLKRHFPQLPGRFIVQDLAQSFPVGRPPGVEFMEHDFTTEQPIKGARLYYLRYVPHDWSQEFNIHLCSQLRKAMTPGYSRLIVNEWILSESGPTKFMAAFDFNMMAASSGMERTLALHREYLEKAGLKITNVYGPGDKISESVIEAEVA